MKALINRLFAWLQRGGAAQERAAFLPAALEIIETPASPAGRAIGASLIGFFLAALLWSILGSVDIIAVASGKIVPSGRSKTIQPFETGVVRAIHVHDGQIVKAGEVLLELDPTFNEGERSKAETELQQAQLDAARLRALTAGDTAGALTWPEPSTAAGRALQEQILANQRRSIAAKLKSLDEQIAQSSSNQAAVEATIMKLQDSLPLLSQRTEIRQKLSAQGYGSKLEALTTQQQLLETQNELKVQNERLREARSATAALREQRLLTETEAQQKNLAELSEAEQKIAILQERLVQATQKSSLQTLTAPVDGTVQQLAVHTEGGVVTPAQALMVIVPSDSRIEIEAMVSNRDIGFVYAGQDVAIKIDTFNFTKYGLLHGTVQSVSQDAIPRQKPTSAAAGLPGADNASSEPSGQELVYAARITLEQTQMNIDGKNVNLVPGMAVTTEIKTGTRRIIEFLLSPLARHSQQAMRER